MASNLSNFENVLQTIHSKYISLPEHEVRRNNEILNRILTQIINEMKDDAVFMRYYNRIFYGGSYFDGLRVGKPEEFDLDFLLKVPKLGKPVLEHTNEPGFLSLKFQAPDELSAEFKKKMLDDRNYLSTKKVREWMKSVFMKALNKFLKNGTYVFHDGNNSLTGRTSESGPAMTLILKGSNINIDIDFVPCFEFGGDQWPQAGYKKNPVPSKNTFFIVPKSPKNKNPAERYWRLSFQEQERELINGKRTLKPTVKLFKRLRDVQQHKAVASYYIKTVFLLENEKNGDSYWNDTNTKTFFKMLEKYIEYIEKGNIPYFWNKKNNLLNISSATRDNMLNRLRAIQKDLLAKYQTEPLVICKYLGFSAPVTETREHFFPERYATELSAPETATSTSTSTSKGLSGFSKLAIGLGIGIAAIAGVAALSSSSSNRSSNRGSNRRDDDSD